MSGILGIVCARGGSQRLPGKNTKIIGGISLLERAVATLVGSRVDDVVTAADFDPGFDLAKYGARHILRPGNISGGEVPLQETVKWVYSSLGKEYDHIVFLMPNCPAITSSDIDSAIDILIDSKMNVVRSFNREGHENGIVAVRTKYLLDHFIDVYCGGIVAGGEEIHSERDYLKIKKELES